MFRDPASGGGFAPEEPIDITKRYLVRLMDVIDEGVSPYAKDKANPEHSLKWIFRVAHADTKAPLLTIEGDPFELWQFSSNRTGKANGKTAKARMFMEALVGRELTDEEVKTIKRDQLLNKVAIVMFDENEQGRISILRLRPYDGTVEPEPTPKSTPARANPPMKQAAAVSGAVDAPW